MLAWAASWEFPYRHHQEGQEDRIEGAAGLEDRRQHLVVALADALAE
jgi:hypothetical protein